MSDSKTMFDISDPPVGVGFVHDMRGPCFSRSTTKWSGKYSLHSCTITRNMTLFCSECQAWYEGSSGLNAALGNNHPIGHACGRRVWSRPTCVPSFSRLIVGYNTTAFASNFHVGHACGSPICLQTVSVPQTEQESCINEGCDALTKSSRAV